MPLVSIRLPEDIEARLASEAERAGRPRSEIAREAIAEYLDRLERSRFLGAIARAARAVDSTEALELAEEALPFDNEALVLGEAPGVHEAGPAYRAGRRNKKKKR